MAYPRHRVAPDDGDTFLNHRSPMAHFIRAIPQGVRADANMGPGRDAVLAGLVAASDPLARVGDAGIARKIPREPAGIHRVTEHAAPVVAGQKRRVGPRCTAGWRRDSVARQAERDRAWRDTVGIFPE